MITKQSDPQFKVRMPPSVREWIAEKAMINNRSMTAEINFRLEQAMLVSKKKAAAGEPTGT